MGGVNTCKHHQYHAPNKTKPIEYQSRLWALVGGVDIPLQYMSSSSAAFYLISPPYRGRRRQAAAATYEPRAGHCKRE